MQRVILTAASAAPAPLSPDMAQGPAAAVYRHLRLEGRWLPDRVVYLDNRPNAGRAGLYVLMPLRLDPPSAVDVIVNRGWIPRNAADRSRIAPYVTPTGRVTVTGIALAEEPRLLELTTPGERRLRGLWQNFDVAAYARATEAERREPVQNPGSTGRGDAADGANRPTLSIVVREDAEHPVAVRPDGEPLAAGDLDDGLIRDWADRGAALQQQIDRHHGYAFQWFALATTLAAIVVFQLVRLLRHGRNLSH